MGSGRCTTAAWMKLAHYKFLGVVVRLSPDTSGQRRHGDLDAFLRWVLIPPRQALVHPADFSVCVQDLKPLFLCFQELEANSLFGLE